MVRARQVRDAAAFVQTLDDVQEAAVLRALVLAAVPRIVDCDGVLLTGDLSEVVVQGALDPDELALVELLRPPLREAAGRIAARERRARAGLTRRETQVLEHVAAGDSNTQVARRLGVRPRTIDKHLEHAYAKLGVASRTAAIAHLRGIAH
jgi:DNA-binding CsgD family transcriptional regulator